MQFLLPALVLAVLPERFVAWIWVNESRRLVLLALLASFLLNQAWGMLTQLAEARRLTVLIQIVMVAQAALHLVLVAMAFYVHWLSVSTVLIFTVGEYAACILLLLPRLTRENVDHHAESDSLWDTLTEFAGYCQPLVVIGWVGFAHAFLERWLLQRYGGSAQQGFFTVANQFATIGGILTVSVVKVLWKEIAEATEQGNVARVTDLYAAATRGLFFAIAWICCLLMPYARDILGWTVGAAFTGATLSFTVMLAYPDSSGARPDAVDVALRLRGHAALLAVRVVGHGREHSGDLLRAGAPHGLASGPGLGRGGPGAQDGRPTDGDRERAGVFDCPSPRLGRPARDSGDGARLAPVRGVGVPHGGPRARGHWSPGTPPTWLTMAVGTTLYAAVTLLVAIRFPALTGLNRLWPHRPAAAMAPTR